MVPVAVGGFQGGVCMCTWSVFICVCGVCLCSANVQLNHCTRFARIGKKTEWLPPSALA